MKGHGSRVRSQIPRVKGQGWTLKKTIVILLAACYLLLAPVSFAAEKWAGVDESVVGKYAKEHGREAHEPLINTDQGDLLLFVFLIAGTVGGFVAGYYWRILMVEKAPTTTSKKNNTPSKGS